LTTTGFQASVVSRTNDGSTQRWHIREDARVWKE
jgi:hypothetical protein